MNNHLVLTRWMVAVFLSGLMFIVRPVSADDGALKQDATFRVVGYLPDYRVEQIDAGVGRKMTDLIFFSVVPELRGRFVSKVLDSPKTVRLLKQFRDEQKVKVHLCIGGWDRSQGFAEIASTAESRRLFANGLTDYCRKHGFDGADIDWEHPKDSAESTNYGLMLAEISRAFKPAHLQLTAAMAAWQTLTPEGIAAVEAIHVMSYDAPGKHSTLETAQADVRKLVEAGVPAKKIRLGIPFYGRGMTNRDQVKTYAEIVATEPKSVDADESGGLYFNGPSTIRAKIRFAKDQMLGGVMVWEIGQDAPGDASLLKVIHEETK